MTEQNKWQRRISGRAEWSDGTEGSNGTEEINEIEVIEQKRIEWKMEDMIEWAK